MVIRFFLKKYKYIPTKYIHFNIFSFFHLKSEWAKGDKSFSLTRLSNCDHSIDKPIIEKYLALVKTYSEMNNIIENVKPLGIKALVRNHSKYVH